MLLIRTFGLPVWIEHYTSRFCIEDRLSMALKAGAIALPHFSCNLSYCRTTCKPPLIRPL